jgi:hypothetical protein
LLKTKIVLFARWKKKKIINRNIEKRTTYKVHLLQEQSVRMFYRERLNQQLNLWAMSSDVNEE